MTLTEHSIVNWEKREGHKDRITIFCDDDEWGAFEVAS